MFWGGSRFPSKRRGKTQPTDEVGRGPTCSNGKACSLSGRQTTVTCPFAEISFYPESKSIAQLVLSFSCSFFSFSFFSSSNAETEKVEVLTNQPTHRHQALTLSRAPFRDLVDGGLQREHGPLERKWAWDSEVGSTSAGSGSPWTSCVAWVS